MRRRGPPRAGGARGVKQRSAIGAKIEGILGVNKVVIEGRSQKRKKALKLSKALEVDPLRESQLLQKFRPIPPLITTDTHSS